LTQLEEIVLLTMETPFKIATEGSLNFQCNTNLNDAVTKQ